MSHIEKVKKVREATLSPVNKVNDALKRANDDVDAAIKLLIDEKQADANDMAKRTANTSIVYSYVHNNRVGAMVVLACQTDFVARNEAFLGLAKDICMHIVSAPTSPQFVDQAEVPGVKKAEIHNDCALLMPGFDKKPQAVQQKIIDGKLAKYYVDNCLLNQKFVKDDSKTVDQLIKEASSTLGEKIEVKKFVKMIAQ